MHMAETARGIGANTFQFFTRNPRGGKAKELDVDDCRAFMESWNGTVVAHAPYTLNPCSDKEKVREFARMVMEDDLARMEAVPGNCYNLHPGSHVGQGTGKGIEMIAELLNGVMKQDMHTTVLLETMAGKGSEIGGKFEELKAIIDLAEQKDKIGICLDTCHVWDGGYDVRGNFDGVLDELDRVIGIERLKAVHINDSKNPMGARKDRHACIGEGEIGYEALRYVVDHEAVRGLPCILETPNDLDGYRDEIKRLRG